MCRSKSEQTSMKRKHATAQEIMDRDRDSQALPRGLRATRGIDADYRFYRFGARYEYCYLGFDVETGQFVGILDARAALEEPGLFFSRLQAEPRLSVVQSSVKNAESPVAVAYALQTIEVAGTSPRDQLRRKVGIHG